MLIKYSLHNKGGGGGCCGVSLFFSFLGELSVITCIWIGGHAIVF